jgi:hypothetical protein
MLSVLGGSLVTQSRAEGGTTVMLFLPEVLWEG